MAEYKTSYPRKRKKKKWTKKRIKRYARAWFFRILFVLIILLTLFLVVTGVKAVARGIGHLVSGGSDKNAAISTQIGTEPTDEGSGSDREESSSPAETSEAAESTAAETETAVPVSTEAPTEAHEPVIQKLTLSAAGDCALGTTQNMGYEKSFTEYYDKNGPDYFFSRVTDIFAADDLTLVNLECVLSESTRRVDKQFNIKGKPEYTRILTGASIEAVSLGNNHSADYGQSSLQDTQVNLSNAGVKWAIDDKLATYKTDDGLVVGIVSKEIIAVSPEKEQEMLDGIKRLKDMGVNLIVACCHWGTEKAYDASAKQVNLAHNLIDAGADLVLGSHPHVLEGIEVYNGKVICYSLGNFSFGGSFDPYDCDSMIYQQTFTFHDGQVQIDLNSRVIPCRTTSSEEVNDYQPKVVSGDEKKAIIDKLNTHSQGLGDVLIDSDGRLSADLSVAEPAAPETSAGETPAADGAGDTAA